MGAMTRPVRATLKPGRVAAQHPMLKAKPQTALLAAPTSLAAPAAAPGLCTKKYPWGVMWPGKSVAATPDFQPAEVKKAFQKWHEFNTNGSEWTGAITMTAIETAMYMMPGKKF